MNFCRFYNKCDKHLCGMMHKIDEDTFPEWKAEGARKKVNIIEGACTIILYTIVVYIIYIIVSLFRSVKNIRKEMRKIYSYIEPYLMSECDKP